MRQVAIVCALILSVTAGGQALASSIHLSSTPAPGKASKRERPRRPTRKTGRRHTTRNVLNAVAAKPGASLLGDRDVESRIDSNQAGSAEAFPFTDQASGSVSSLVVYVDSHSRATALVAGLYSDAGGHPGSLITVGSSADPRRGAWDTVRVGSTALTSGQRYWLAILGRGGALYFRDRSPGPCSGQISSVASLTTLPAPWKPGLASPGCPLSAYVAGSFGTTASAPAGSPPSTPAAPATITVPADTTPPADFSQPPAILPPIDVLPPTISGTLVDGQTLTASTGTWIDSPDSYSYQWQACDASGSNCSDIAGAVGNTYTLTDSDVGNTVLVVVTATNSAGSSSATTAQTAPVAPPPAPVNTSAPAISGSATQGQTLSSTDGAWTNSPESFTYVWQDCNSGGDSCMSISGATSSTYTLASNDVGHTIRAVVTATNAGGSASATSAQTAAVTAPPSPPTNTAVPQISGTTVQGDSLTTSKGSWTGSPTSYAYKWQDCDSSGSSCTNISGATSSTHALTSSDVGHTIRAVVTATNVAGSASATSAQTAVVTAPPSNSGLPVVSGSAVQGGVLSTSNGSWSGSPTGYGYQWEDCDGSGAGCVSVAGATASSYTLQASDVGHTVRAVVTASNGAGSTSAVSAQTGVVTAPASAPSMTAAPQITGTASQGNRLSGSSGSWSGTTPMSYGYQWEDCDSSGAGCVNVAGATASTYTLQASDVGHTMRVAVTASNSAGSGSGTSGQSAMVSASSGSGPTDTAAPTITGVADTGSFVAPQLVASSGSWSGSPTRYTYQWQDCNSSGANCVNAAGETYGPGASGSSCVTTVAANGCAYNLVAKEATAPCPYASGATGACTIGLIVTATNAQGSTPVSVAPVGPVKASSTAWPNFSNTGYQNAPGYPGTAGVPDPSKLTIASAGSSTCPTTIQSNHTYSFCHYTGGLDVGASGQDVSNVHFIGDLFDDSSPYGDSEAIILYCDNNCTFDYVTVSPTGMSVPDLPMPGHGLNWNGNQIGHGVTYSKGYGAICACGWGAHNSVGHGFSFTHSDMWGWGSGIITGPNTSATPITIQNNWIHDEGDCDSDNNCSEHTDGIGMVDTGSTSSYITIDHNNMPFILNNTNDLAFQQGTYNHLNITNNTLSGDGNTVAIWHTSTNITFTGNLWTNYAQQEYGVNYGEDFWDTTGSTWAHNKFAWDPTGVTTLYQNGPNPFDNYTPSGTQYTTNNNNQCWVPTGLSTTDYGGGTC